MLRSLPALTEDVDPSPSPAHLPWSPQCQSSSAPGASPDQCPVPGIARPSLWPGLGTQRPETATSPGATWQNLPISREEFAHGPPAPGGLGRAGNTPTHVCWLQRRFPLGTELGIIFLNLLHEEHKAKPLLNNSTCLS